MSIVMSAIILSSNVPAAYCAMLSVLDIAVNNAMACRVFRDVKLGLIDDGLNNTSTIVPPSRLRFGPSHDMAMKDSMFDKIRTRQINVEITQITTIE